MDDVSGSQQIERIETPPSDVVLPVFEPVARILCNPCDRASGAAERDWIVAGLRECEASALSPQANGRTALR